MKSKTWLLLSFILTSLIYVTEHGIINHYYQQVFENSSLYNRGAWIKENNINPKIIFLGSSMTRYSIIPELIEKNNNLNKGDIVNLGMDAATPYEMYITYMKNKQYFSKTQIVFFSLEPWILSKRYYKYKMFEKALWSDEEWDYYMPNENNFAGYKTYLFFKSIFAKDAKLKVENAGYIRLEHNNQFKLADEKEIKAFFTNRVANEIDISIFELEYLKKLKQEVEKNNSEFVLLFIPNHISYTQVINKVNTQYNLKLSELLNIYLGETKQFGMYDPTSLNLLHEDYFDKHHLSYTGAVKYSTLFTDILDLPKDLKKSPINIRYQIDKFQ